MIFFYLSAETVTINPSLEDGFGGSIALWGINADDQALSKAIDELGVKIVRVQGEISPRGVVDFNKKYIELSFI